MAEAESLRLDKFLWFARIAKTRSQAQAMAEAGRIRMGGRVEALPARRGPPAEARAHYAELPADPSSDPRAE